MSDFWELGNAFGFEDDEPKKKKKKKKEKKGKDGKKNKDKKYESEKAFQAVKKDMSYSDFLKEGKNGLYLARYKTEDGHKTLECVIVKVSDHFKYPMVALTEDGVTYKDWLKKAVEKHDLKESVNKIMYNSRVEKITGLCQSFIADVIAKTFEKDEEEDDE